MNIEPTGEKVNLKKYMEQIEQANRVHKHALDTKLSCEYGKRIYKTKYNYIYNYILILAFYHLYNHYSKNHQNCLMKKRKHLHYFKIMKKQHIHHQIQVQKDLIINKGQNQINRVNTN